MTDEEYIQFLRSVVLTIEIDTATEKSLNRLTANYSKVVAEMFEELGQDRKFRTGKMSNAAITARIKSLQDQIQLLENVTVDIAGITADAGELAYPGYNNIVSWDERVEFNPVLHSRAELLESIITAQVGGNNLPEWVNAAVDQAMKNSIDTGLLKREGYDAMVDSLKKQFPNRMEHELVTLTRTYSQTINVAAQTDVYAANRHLVREIKWQAFLESGNVDAGTGTCPRCAALDGQTWKMDDYGQPVGGPQCPLHARCRCLLASVPRTWKELGLDVEEMEQSYRPAVTRTEEAIGVGGQREILDITKEGGNYADWWHTKGATFQDNAIGPVRAELIRQGKIDFTDIIDAHGNMIPIVKLVDMPWQKLNRPS